jgi:hypothetical protein
MEEEAEGAQQTTHTCLTVIEGFQSSSSFRMLRQTVPDG